MDRTWHLAIRIAALASALLVPSCAATPSRGPETAVPTPTTSGTAGPSTSAVAGTGSATPLPATTSGLPQETCAAFLPTAPCATYGSVAPTSNGTAVPWAAAGTVKVQLTSVSGTLQLAMKTDCSPISAPVTITGNTLTVGNIAIGAMGCLAPAGEHETWILEFLKRPIAMTYAQNTLTWASGTETLSFKTG